MASLMAEDHRPGGRGLQPSRWLQLPVCLRGMAAPNGAHSQAGWTGRPAQLVVAAHGAPMGDGSPHWCKLTGWEYGESSPASGCSSPCARGGWQPPMVHAHRVGGRGDQPSRWLQLSVHLWGMAAPNGAGPQAGGDG